jgi:ABC-type oligopeptide transport system substrate-binding subunit
MIWKLFAIALLLFLLLAVFGCVLTNPTSNSGTPSPDLNKIKALESNNKKLQAGIEQLQLQAGVYKSLNDCKEKALVIFIDGNTIVQKTTLKDAFDRCDVIFSAMKALAEKPG